MHPDLIAEISHGAIRRNLARIRRVCGEGVGVCAVVKANAYGHGVRAVIGALAPDLVEVAAVTSLPEAVELRELKWTRPLICLGQPLGIRRSGERAERLTTIVEQDVVVAAGDLMDVADLEATAAKLGRRVGVQVNVETGMGRLGVLPDEAVVLARAVQASNHLDLFSVFTHLAVAEQRDHPHNARQLAAFATAREELAAAGIKPRFIHSVNSSGGLSIPEARFDFVRAGLAMYGYRLDDDAVLPEPLEPCLRLRSHIVMCKTVPAGHTVGYGCRFVAERPTRVGIVPIGYSDGYRRSLTNVGMMRAGGADVPVIGTVSMDLTAIDLTDAPSAGVGDPVVIIDERPRRPNSVQSLARTLHTVPYEITCLLGSRIGRVPVEEFSEHN